MWLIRWIEILIQICGWCSVVDEAGVILSAVAANDAWHRVGDVRALRDSSICVFFGETSLSTRTGGTRPSLSGVREFNETANQL